MTAVSAAVQAEAASAARYHGQCISVDDLAWAMQISRARAREITDAMLAAGLWQATDTSGRDTRYGRPGGLDGIIRIT